MWEPTPPAFAPMLEPQFQNVVPFTLRDRSQFLPDPPPSITSRRYARDYSEVKLVARDISPARTPDQTHIAHFWAEASPSGWSRVGNLVSARYRYDLHRTARLQALLNMAMADGFIVGWFQKRHFALWRPSRVLAGFHFRFAIETGDKVGRKVGRFAMRHALRACAPR